MPSAATHHLYWIWVNGIAHVKKGLEASGALIPVPDAARGRHDGAFTDTFIYNEPGKGMQVLVPYLPLHSPAFSSSTFCVLLHHAPCNLELRIRGAALPHGSRPHAPHAPVRRPQARAAARAVRHRSGHVVLTLTNPCFSIFIFNRGGASAACVRGEGGADQPLSRPLAPVRPRATRARPTPSPVCFCVCSVAGSGRW
jgi:hypothetical protein